MQTNETSNIERINNIRNNMRRHIDTHPNLIRVWDNYLNIRLQKLDQALTDCEKLEERINAGHPDLTLEQIYMIRSIYTRVNNN